MTLGPLAGVKLRPLERSDAAALFALTPPGTFAYFLNEPEAWTLAAFEAWMEKRLFQPGQEPFAVVDDASGVLLGSSSYLDIQPEHRHVEIGCTWYAPHCRGTRVNPACKWLMLGHAFERMFGGLGAVRVTIKCDARNLHSQRAIAKLGAVREGTLRKHRIRPDGFVRDTVYFSIIKDEWPAVRAGIEARLGERF